MRPASTCIYYHPEAYTTSGPKLMGRNAAGESFLKGFLKYTQPSNFLSVQVESNEHAEHFTATARKAGRSEQIRSYSRQNLIGLKEAGVMYLPGPAIGEHAFHRRLYGDASWSLSGITHTTSSAVAMDAITELLTAPVKPWDSLICTSTAVKQNVEAILQAQTDYLQERLGISKLPLPLFPVIPLGINTEEFTFSNKQKAGARKNLGLRDEDLVVLYAGRLSFHAKAHPLPMYLGLEIAAKKTKKNVVLIESGWHANPQIADAFAEAANIACPSVRIINVDGREEPGRRNAWASADVFCSLSDNIQETFGIVPIEAMAAGLPVVVSDWNGYKDTVRDGVDGFRIKTMAPAQGLTGDLAHRHALGIDNYDHYCGYSSSLVAVDVEGVANAFTELFSSEELRKRMGNSGKERALKQYDWREVIKKYEELWEKQNSIRSEEQKRNKHSLLPGTWPARLDPTVSFSHYPTKTLSLETPLKLVPKDLETAIARLQTLKKLKMFDFAAFVIPSDKELKQVLTACSNEPKRAEQILSEIDQERRPHVLRGIGWLAKIGIIDFS